MSRTTLWRIYSAAAPRTSEDWSASDRGWFWETHGRLEREDWTCLGHYLDYGPEHYRSPHKYCRPGECRCRRSQPGNVHAVVTLGDRPARYFRTPKEAREWIEAEAARRRSLLAAEGR